MPRLPLIVAIATFLIAQSAISAETLRESERLYSPTVAQKLYEAAHEHTRRPQPDKSQIERGLTLYRAIMNLDPQADYALPGMIELMSRDYSQDHSPQMTTLLRRYINASADLEIAEKGITYLLAQQNTREEREELLAEMLSDISGRNAMLESQILTKLGDFAAEQADFDTAHSYYMNAYDQNPYNNTAFDSMLRLSQGQVNTALYLKHLRRQIMLNPFSVEAAVNFAEQSRSLELYQPSASAYEYSAELWEHNNPDRPLPDFIYLPWAFTCYQDSDLRENVNQIAQSVRDKGKFDFMLEVIAGKAAQRMGDSDKADEIFDSILNKAKQQIEQEMNLDFGPAEIAWFYCVVRPDADEAVDWANKAYAAEDSPIAAALLAYALVMNEQFDFAKSLANEHADIQIARLALGRIELEKGQTEDGIETIKKAVAMDPSSLTAEIAREILEQNNAQYRPEIDTSLLITDLRNEFGQRIIPRFRSADELVSVELKLQGSEFSYGRSFDAKVALSNQSDDEILISQGAMLEGNIRIDAKVSGGLDERIEKLLVKTVRPSTVIRPGQSILIPVELMTGELASLSKAHPQANLDITFTLYMDPRVSENGRVQNSLISLEPDTATARRRRTELSVDFMRNRLEALARGRQNQKMTIARLFAGLLLEQQTMAGKEPMYSFRYADWMPSMLKSAIISNLDDDSWVVRTSTMLDMLPLRLDYELTAAVAQNLHEEHWPVRLAAVKLLSEAEKEGFQQVLNWAAENDRNPLVRDMAVALGAIVESE